MSREMHFPMLDAVPAVAIDFDGTLAKYHGWKGPSVLGRPRENAIWALRCFKYNGWDVEIFTNRDEVKYIWMWVRKWAPCLVDRVNESRESAGKERGRGKSSKPSVDLFVDDRSWETWGEELDWVRVMRVLESKGLMPKGLLELTPVKRRK